MIRSVIITVSDKGSKGEREDKSGQVIKEMITEINGDIVDYKIIPDERAIIKEEMKIIADSDKADLVLTTGGTGFAERDITPEATAEIIEKEVPGIPEKMRMDTVKITPMAALSRAKAGIRGKTLIVNLPG
ncbi:MAG TPA: MogA/MoaB family molybdenum cofactor biosynthesis protein, partial [Halanaerobiales bacterium]|nr:MogA/MoaB family molybdenum cofactor biosynthesis protein [Halanaerobiales bacterium]